MFPSKGAKVIVALHFSAFTEANVVEVFVPPDVFLAPSVVLQSKGEMWMMGTFVLICKHTGWNMKHPQNDANWTRFGDTFIGLLNNSTPKPLCSHRVYWWQWADWLSTVSRYWTCKHAARESQWISIIHIVCWTHNIWQPHQHMFFSIGHAWRGSMGISSRIDCICPTPCCHTHTVMSYQISPACSWTLCSAFARI